jgi:hypothetical protein
VRVNGEGTAGRGCAAATWWTWAASPALHQAGEDFVFGRDAVAMDIARRRRAGLLCALLAIGDRHHRGRRPGRRRRGGDDDGDKTAAAEPGGDQPKNPDPAARTAHQAGTAA